MFQAKYVDLFLKNKSDGNRPLNRKCEYISRAHSIKHPGGVGMLDLIDVILCPYDIVAWIIRVAPLALEAFWVYYDTARDFPLNQI